MSSQNLRDYLLGLGISAIIVSGLILYFESKKDYLTYEEYQTLITLYNQKITEIKNNCEHDTRCIMENGIPKVKFKKIKTIKDLIKTLEKWSKEDSQLYAK